MLLKIKQTNVFSFIFNYIFVVNIKFSNTKREQKNKLTRYEYNI